MDINSYKGFAFDLDGVLWRGTDVISGAPEAIKKVRNLGGKITFVTNNASQNRLSHQRKLISMGIEADLTEVVTSGFAAAKYLATKHTPGEIYVMGTEDLQVEMAEAGHTLVSKDADYVVVGFDKSFNYTKLDIAYQNICNGALFVACNENPTYPAEDGFHPGVGASVEALAYAVGKRPDIIIGKPHTPIMDITLDTLGLPAKECLFVSDLLRMDIKGAQDRGFDTALVLSGIDKEEDIQKTGITPTYVINSVADLV